MRRGRDNIIKCKIRVQESVEMNEGGDGEDLLDVKLFITSRQVSVWIEILYYLHVK